MSMMALSYTVRTLEARYYLKYFEGSWMPVIYYLVIAEAREVRWVILAVQTVFGCSFGPACYQLPSTN